MAYRSAPIIRIFFSLLFALSTSRAIAADAVGPENIFLKWIGPRGNEISPGWSTQSEWVWPQSNEETGDSLILRTQIQLPNGTKIENIQGSHLRFKKSPLNESPPKLVIDLKGDSGNANFLMKAPDGSEQELGLLIQTQFQSPSTITHPSCEEMGFLIKRTSNSEAQIPYVAIKCNSLSDHAEIKWITPDGINLKIKSLNPGVVKEPPGGLDPKNPELTIDQIALQDSTDRNLAQATVKSPQSKQTALFELYSSKEARKQKRLQFQAGLGPTLINYKESPQAVDVSEIMLTAQASGRYEISKKFDFNLSFFLNTVAFSRSPKATPEIKFYGINSRFGYALPVGSPSFTLRLYAGWYFWGSIVSDKSYGISSLAGPQILLSATARPGGQRSKPFTLFTKLAPISTSLSSASLSEREISFGIGYPITPVYSNHPINLTFTYSNLIARSSDRLITATLSTYSVGLDYLF